MNSNHDKLCGSPEWAAHIQDEVLPVVTARVVPVEPSTLLVRLQTLGFGAVMVAVDEVLMFTARKPSSQERDQAA